MMTSCLGVPCTNKIERPSRPDLKPVATEIVNGEKCYCGDNRVNAIDNMWNLQIYIKRLEAHPGWK